MPENPPSDSDDLRMRSEAGTMPPWFKLYEDRLEQLAEAVADGAKDSDLKLAEIVDNAPQDMRGGLVARFRELVQEKTKARSAPPVELTPEQEQAMALLKHHEELFIAHLLSKKTLEKIRRALLTNPQLVREVISLSEEMQRKGMMTETAKVKTPELGEMAASTGKSADKAKEGRER